MIKDVISKLDLKDRRVLDYAFNHSLSQIVKIDDGKKFVGVNVKANPTIIIEEKVGVWSCGRLVC